MELRTSTLDTIRKINSEVRAYWSRLQDEAEKALKDGSNGHH